MSQSNLKLPTPFLTRKVKHKSDDDGNLLYSKPHRDDDDAVESHLREKFKDRF
jgi:hypothetical protein